MNKRHQLLFAIGTLGLFAAPIASAIPFVVTGASFTAGSGYGIDSSESSGTLLDVQFSTSGFATQDFALSLAGDSFTFNVGTVNFQELNAHGGILGAETDNLSVIAGFIFASPLGTSQNVVGTATVATGAVSDSHIDYAIVWSPVTVAFGSGGLFEIAMNSLTFAGTGSQVQTATITLKNPSADVNPVPERDTLALAVPEPATLALACLGLLGSAGFRRKSARNDAVG